MTIIRREAVIQPIENEYQTDVLRLDLIHPVTGGNKLFKLKYNIVCALDSEHRTILTFGGANSNHIAATAVACREAGLRSVGIIRGGDHGDTNTLRIARDHGMILEFERKGIGLYARVQRRSPSS